MLIPHKHQNVGLEVAFDAYDHLRSEGLDHATAVSSVAFRYGFAAFKLDALVRERFWTQADAELSDPTAVGVTSTPQVS